MNNETLAPGKDIEGARTLTGCFADSRRSCSRASAYFMSGTFKIGFPVLRLQPFLFHIGSQSLRPENP